MSYITREGTYSLGGSAFAHARPAQAGHAQKPYLAIGDGTKFAGIGEETLRSHFLLQRYGVYEGQATEETFNFEGNTDILIWVGCDTFGPAMPNVEEAQPIVAFAEACYTLAWSADKEFLAGAHPGGVIRLWEVESGQEVRRVKGHKDHSRPNC